MISQEKGMILTPLQKLPKNVEDSDKLIVAKGLKKLPKVQKIAQSGHTGQCVDVPSGKCHSVCQCCHWGKVALWIVFFKKNGPFPASFYCLLFNVVNNLIKFHRWLDSNRVPLVSEATTLPTEPQPLHCGLLFVVNAQKS